MRAASGVSTSGGPPFPSDLSAAPDLRECSSLAPRCPSHPLTLQLTPYHHTKQLLDCDDDTSDPGTEDAPTPCEEGDHQAPPSAALGAAFGAAGHGPSEEALGADSPLSRMMMLPRAPRRPPPRLSEPLWIGAHRGTALSAAPAAIRTPGPTIAWPAGQRCVAAAANHAPSCCHAHPAGFAAPLCLVPGAAPSSCLNPALARACGPCLCASMSCRFWLWELWPAAATWRPHRRWGHAAPAAAVPEPAPAGEARWCRGVASCGAVQALYNGYTPLVSRAQLIRL